ncbi:MAG: ABC transporter [Gallionellales bacterium RIFCSPLOWO2_02_FULL_57_47]|nr:MAG: ABC transporter [Gallionellales bacterium RIFCSPLOWO2_02_FULL_57_47]
MLAIKNLAYRYPQAEKPALADVSLNTARGQILGLLGPNGAGKTTLISHLSGMLPVQQGGISVDGQPLAVIRRNTPTRIAVAPQEYAFYPMLTVLENLDCFASAGGLGGPRKQQRMTECLAFAQLERFAQTRAERLSGGLKRRLNLAIALLPEPELILLDEPTVGVDPQSRAFLLDAVKTLARNGAAVIYTSHYMEEIEAIADRVVILDDGKVLCDGTLDELLGGGAVRVLLGVEGVSGVALSALLDSFGTVTAAGVNWLVTLAPEKNPVALLAALEQAGGRVRYAEFGRSNLEQLFMTLTHRLLRD